LHRRACVRDEHGQMLPRGSLSAEFLPAPDVLPTLSGFSRTSTRTERPRRVARTLASNKVRFWVPRSLRLYRKGRALQSPQVVSLSLHGRAIVDRDSSRCYPPLAKNRQGARHPAESYIDPSLASPRVARACTSSG
jgi:hypothetical protein